MFLYSYLVWYKAFLYTLRSSQVTIILFIILADDSNKIRTKADRIPNKGILKYYISLQIAWPVIANVGIVGSRV
jgi:hypothetical protein